METLVALAPGLSLTADELAAAWNADAACRATADAHTTASQGKEYGVEQLAHDLLVLAQSPAGVAVETLAVATARDVLKDLLRQLIERLIKSHLPHGSQQPALRTEVELQTRRDGSTVLVVTQGEEQSP